MGLEPKHLYSRCESFAFRALHQRGLSSKSNLTLIHNAFASMAEGGNDLGFLAQHMRAHEASKPFAIA